MSNQPVYRRPRSHAYSCRCPRCQGAGAYSTDLSKGCLIPVAICAVIAGAVGLALVPLGIWHVTGADGKMHPDTATGIAYGIGAVLILAALMFVSIRATGKRERSSPPARYVAPRPAPPLCVHRNAVRVESAVDPAVTLGNWCPDCETALGVIFRRSCCSTPPGTRPGAGHLYNCPQRKGDPR